MGKKGQSYKKYKIEEKERIVKEHLKEGISSIRLGEKYNINYKTIDTWIYKYRHQENLKDNRERPKDKDMDYKEKYEILKKYQAFLKEQREKK